jgi:hypothetical protein
VRESSLGAPRAIGREVTMASQGAQAPTNERSVRLVQEVQAELAECKKREQQIARDLKRLLDRK